MSLKIQQLTKLYGEQKALDEISFSAKPGEVLGFLGPNGAGKSTTMKIATAYIPPSEGKVEVCGLDVIQSSKEVRKKVGYLPENNPLYPDMYVEEYLHFVASLYKINRRLSKKRVSEVIELVGLEQEKQKKIGALSKGYRQRVGLGQTLIHDPEVLILDEPTTGLDPNQVLEVRNVIAEIGQQKTVVFSTHIMQEVKALCSRVVIIDQGKIIADGPVNQLGHEKRETIISLEFEKPPSDLSAFEQLEGIQKVVQKEVGKIEIRSNTEKDIRGDLFRLAVSQGLTLIGMKKEEVGLEQVFNQLTQSNKKTIAKN